MFIFCSLIQAEINVIITEISGKRHVSQMKKIVIGLILRTCFWGICFLFLYQFIHIFSGEGLYTDEGYYLSMAKRISKGEVMYRDFFTFYMPLPFYITGLFFHFTGPSYFIARLIIIALISLAAVTGFAIVNNLLRGGWLSFLAPVFLVSLTYPFWKIFTPRYFSLFFSTATLYFLYRSTEKNKTGYILTAGIFCGLNILSIQSDGIMLFFSSLLFILLFQMNEKKTIKAVFAPLLIFFSGSIMAVAPFFIYLLIKGAGFLFLYDTTYWITLSLMHYLHTPYFYGGIVYIQNLAGKALLSPLNFLLNISAIVTLIIIGFMPIIIYFLSLIIIIKEYLKNRALSPFSIKILLLTITGAGLLIANINRTDPLHLLLVSFNWVSIALFYFKKYIYAPEKRTLTKYVVNYMLLFYFIGIILFDIIGLYMYKKTYIFPIRGVNILYTNNKQIADEMNALKQIFEVSIPENTTVFGYCWMGAHLFFLERDNKFRHDVLLPYHSTEDQLLEGLEYLKGNQVPYIILDSGIERLYFSLRYSSDPEKLLNLIKNDPISDYIKKNYHPLYEFKTAGIKLLVKNNN